MFAGSPLLMPAAQFGLGHVVDVALQTAINKVAGSDQSHFYLNSPPYYTESAFEFVERDGLGATDVGARAFGGYSHPLAELAHHYIYQRLNGPNDTMLSLTLGGTLSMLSNKDIGTLTMNTGMSCFTALFDLLRPGDSLYYHPILYGCTKNKVASHLPKMGINVFQDRMEDIAALRERLLNDKGARMLLAETESNPMLDILPTDEIAAMTDEVNAKRLAKGWNPVFFVVDNTFPTFANLNPASLGVHCWVESLTKFISGRGENMGGMIAVDLAHDFGLSAADYGGLYNFLAMMQKDDGLSMSPFPAWDISRNLRDIEMRRNHVQATAQKVAEFLKEDPRVASLRYPGMTGDKVQDERAHRLLRNEMGQFSPGYMIHLELKGTPEESRQKGKELLDWLSKNTSLRVKVSFGQQNTLLEMPSVMTHSSYSAAELIAAGIAAGGIRIAIGWDTPEYIIAALRAGLDHVLGRRR